MTALVVTPCTLEEARIFVNLHHSHNPDGTKFARLWTSVEQEGKRVAVGIAGNPKARGIAIAEPRAIEITRVCTDCTRHACSLVYGALCRAAKALGWWRAYTYTLASEDGACLRAAGFVPDAEIDARGGWNCDARPRVEHDLFGNACTPIDEPKIRWRRELVAK